MNKKDFAVYTIDQAGNPDQLKGYFVTDEQLDDFALSETALGVRVRKGIENTAADRKRFCQKLGAEKLEYIGANHWEIIFPPKITNQFIIDELGLADGWIEQQFQEWHDDPRNRFLLDDWKNYISKKRLQKIASYIKEDYLCCLGTDWNTWEEFRLHFDSALKEDNYYWNVFEKIGLRSV
jgi:hypothetical protein